MDGEEEEEEEEEGEEEEEEEEEEDIKYRRKKLYEKKYISGDKGERVEVEEGRVKMG